MKNIPAALFVLLCGLQTSAYALSSHSYAIAVDAVASGGGSVSSTNYNISHLTGQPLVIGPLSSAGYTAQGGFYYIHALEEILLKRVTCIVFTSSAVYAGFDGSGVWKSADSGLSWSSATTQPINMHIRGLVIHPADKTTLYAATYGGGMFTSSDSGDNWSFCTNSGLSGASLNAVTLAIDSSGTLYAGTEGGIFASSDGCSNWSSVNSGLTVDAATPPVAMAIATPATFYAGLDGAGVFRKTAGADWIAVNSGLGNLAVKALVINKSNTNNLYAATYGGGVFKSVNNGDNWSICANTGLSNLNLKSLVIDASGKLYAGTEAGVFVSNDGCSTWAAMSAGLP